MSGDCCQACRCCSVPLVLICRYPELLRFIRVPGAAGANASLMDVSATKYARQLLRYLRTRQPCTRHLAVTTVRAASALDSLSLNHMLAHATSSMPRKNHKWQLHSSASVSRRTHHIRGHSRLPAAVEVRQAPAARRSSETVWARPRSRRLVELGSAWGRWLREAVVGAAAGAAAGALVAAAMAAAAPQEAVEAGNSIPWSGTLLHTRRMHRSASSHSPGTHNLRSGERSLGRSRHTATGNCIGRRTSTLPRHSRSRSRRADRSRSQVRRHSRRHDMQLPCHWARTVSPLADARHANSQSVSAGAHCAA